MPRETGQSNLHQSVCAAADVVVGDYVFPDAWHGGGPVIESYETSLGWALKFDAPVVNPPAIWYGKRGAMVPIRGEEC